MKIDATFAKTKRLYIEAAPLIYFVEENATYIARMDAIIARIEDRGIETFSSVITLTEVITHPLRLGQTELVEEYRDILLNEGHFRLVSVNAVIAETAANLRARYHLRTPDALHIATALAAKCDSFLTNDRGLKRVEDLSILVLDDLELDPTET